MKIPAKRSLMLFFIISILAACSNGGGEDSDNNSKTGVEQGQWNSMTWNEDNWQ